MQLTKNASIDEQWAQRFAHLLDRDGEDPQGVGSRSAVPILQNTSEILTPAEMAEADRLTVEAVASFQTEIRKELEWNRE